MSTALDHGCLEAEASSTWLMSRKRKAGDQLSDSSSSEVEHNCAQRLETVMARMQQRASPVRPEMRKALADVAQQKGWAETVGGVHERAGRLSQVVLSGERSQPLNRQFLFVAAVLAGLYANLIRSTLSTQLERWAAHPGCVLGLTGIDGSYLVPFLFSFWYVVCCIVIVYIMAALQPVESLIFEVMVMYNVIQAAMGAYIVVSMLREAQLLGLRFVGNPVLTHDCASRRLAIIAILHYHLRILELCDTFFLILRKKIGRSSSVHLHVLLRLQNVWGWHIACRFGCGGDIYFPVVANAVSSTILHMHYVLTLVEPHTGQTTKGLLCLFRWLILRLKLKPNMHRRRRLVMVVQAWTFHICLGYGLLSLLSGAYPRPVLVVIIIQCAFGGMLYSNFHYDPLSEEQEKASQPEADEHPAKVAFSFDSSGWCYLYHFGVAMWIQEHFPAEIASGELAFSGSSGGAIVGLCLAAGLDIPLVLGSILHVTWPRVRVKPWLLASEIQRTLELFVPEDGYKLATNRLRVLMTKVLTKPPFCMGEVVSEFRSNSHLFQILAASSHMPFIFGLGYHLDGGRYFDGLLWGSSFVPWRSFSPSQRVCKVSAFSVFGSHIGPRWIGIPPFWWPALPPSQEALEGFMWAGYRDIANAFGSADGRPSGVGPCRRRTSESLGFNAQRLVTSERVDELIYVYESTARRHWMIFFGFALLLTWSCVCAWFPMRSFLAFN